MDKKLELTNYLQSHKLMTLATCSAKPWICTVYYVLDEHQQLYFLSDSEARHVLDIDKNPNVAVAIADSDQGFLAPKIGIQLEGIAAEIKCVGKLKWFFTMWNTQFKGKE